METVYIVGIVAAGVVIVAVVLLLRNRITSGRFGASATEKKVEAEFKAASPQKEPVTPPPAAPEKPPAVDISGNWLIGSNVIRVLRDSVRVASNRLLGKNRIEVSRDGHQAAPAPGTRQKAKRRRR